MTCRSKHQQSITWSAWTGPKEYCFRVLDVQSTIKRGNHKYLTTQAPPATVFPHPLQCQIPTHFLFRASCEKIKNISVSKPIMSTQNSRLKCPSQRKPKMKSRAACLHLKLLISTEYFSIITFFFYQWWTEIDIRLTLPQKTHVYFECCVISIFLTILRSEAPYLVPYFPTTPTFLVLFAYGETKEKTANLTKMRRNEPEA